MFFCGVPAAIKLRLLSGPNFNYPIVGTAALADTTIVGIDPAAIASGYSGLPEIELSSQATVHMEDTSPAALASSGALISFPAVNFFQQDLLGLKLRLKCAWGSALPGAIQVINSISW